MIYVIRRFVKGQGWFYAATDVDWRKRIGPTTSKFDTLAEAYDYRQKYIWEPDAEVVEMVKTSYVNIEE